MSTHNLCFRAKIYMTLGMRKPVFNVLDQVTNKLATGSDVPLFCSYAKKTGFIMAGLILYKDDWNIETTL